MLPGTDPSIKYHHASWALGVTWQLPEHDQTVRTSQNAGTTAAILFGGRIAEEVFGNQNRLGHQTTLSELPKWLAMVTKYGMSDAMGIMVYEDDEVHKATLVLRLALFLKPRNKRWMMKCVGC